MRGQWWGCPYIFICFEDVSGEMHPHCTYSSHTSFGYENSPHTNLFETYVKYKIKVYISCVMKTEFGTFIQ
jgi:hypothetical protein